MQGTLGLLERLADAVARVVDETPVDRFGEPGGMGASGSPAKHIDRVAEEEILRIVETEDAAFNVCSEEVGNVDRGHDKTIVVDPIDGTTNCVRRIPFYCVSLAVTTHGLQDVEVGLVRNLPTGQTYTAVRGEGAKLDGQPITAERLDDGKTLATPTCNRGGVKALPERVHTTKYTRDLGAAALELCLVAQGAMDVYVNTTHGLRIVDIAAGLLILDEAGGAAVTPEGKRPEMGLDVRQRTDLVAARDAALLEQLGVRA